MEFGDPAPGREEQERGPYSSARQVLVAKQPDGPSSQADLRRARGVNGIATDFMRTTGRLLPAKSFVVEQIVRQAARAATGRCSVLRADRPTSLIDVGRPRAHLKHAAQSAVSSSESRVVIAVRTRAAVARSSAGISP